MRAANNKAKKRETRRYTFNEFKTTFLPNMSQDGNPNEMTLSREKFLEVLKRSTPPGQAGKRDAQE